MVRKIRNSIVTAPEMIGFDQARCPLSETGWKRILGFLKQPPTPTGRNHGPEVGVTSLVLITTKQYLREFNSSQYSAHRDEAV
jgi:hypothetical protein